MAPNSIRLARPTDEARLRAMQEASLRALGRSYYSRELMDAFIGQLGTMDASLLRGGGRYFVAELCDELIASGGWSTGAPGYEAHNPDRAGSDPERPVVRSVFVAPLFAGLGIGRKIMEYVEADIAAAGYSEVEVKATLPGVPFYERLGYAAAGPDPIRLPGGLTFPCVRMRKILEAGRRVSRAA